MGIFVIKRFTCYILLSLVFAATFPKIVSAQSCSPGIPCTRYTLTANPNAGTTVNLNAFKSGGSPVLPAPATPFSDATCDGNYMNQMIGQAFMTAGRETVMNEQIIRKPDSVLEYTCFDQLLTQTAAHGATLTESTFWRNGSVNTQTGDETGTISYNFGYPSSHLDIALADLILPSLNRHITRNFSHKFLGGSSAIDHNMNLTSLPGSGSYNCTQMNTIWSLAKCNNFGGDDNFLSFGQLLNGDPRQLPAACRGAPAPVLNAGAPTVLGDVSIASGYIPTLDALGVMTISETNPCPDGTATRVIPTNTIRLSNNCDIDYSAVELARHYFEYIRDPWFGNDLPVVEAGMTSVPLPTVILGLPCGPPIPTGVSMTSMFVTRSPDIPINLTDIFVIPSMNTMLNAPGSLAGLIPGMPSTYIEHVCTNPSCSYLPGVGVCVPPPP